MGELINGRTPDEIKRWLRWVTYRCDPKEDGCATCEYRDDCEEYVFSGAYKEALALINLLESERDAALAKVPKWISVQERLPESAGKYIVCTKKGAVYCTAFRFFHGKGYFATDSTTHITHWMPLPEPPKEEG